MVNSVVNKINLIYAFIDGRQIKDFFLLLISLPTPKGNKLIGDIFH